MIGKLFGAWLGDKIAGKNDGAKGAMLGYGAAGLAKRSVPTLAALALGGWAFKKWRDKRRAHPSYPSAHSCVSGAASGVLMAAFPEERDRLEAVAQEASLSRLYAGIHYRFDMVAGLALGRSVAGKATSADLDAVAVR